MRLIYFVNVLNVMKTVKNKFIVLHVEARLHLLGCMCDSTDLLEIATHEYIELIDELTQ